MRNGEAMQLFLDKCFDTVEVKLEVEIAFHFRKH